MSCWKYKNKDICSIDDIPKEYKDSLEIQIIYKISYGNKFYIGKKIFYNKKKVRLSKKKKLDLKTRKVFEYQIKESNWANYYGSSTNQEFKEILDKVGPDKMNREILMFVEGKMKAAFYEAKYLFSDKGMMHKDCLNLTILNKFFKTKLINGI